jgi:hypothetical protein
MERLGQVARREDALRKRRKSFVFEEPQRLAKELSAGLRPLLRQDAKVGEKERTAALEPAERNLASFEKIAFAQLDEPARRRGGSRSPTPPRERDSRPRDALSARGSSLLGETTASESPSPGAAECLQQPALFLGAGGRVDPAPLLRQAQTGEPDWWPK